MKKSIVILLAAIGMTAFNVQAAPVLVKGWTIANEKNAKAVSNWCPGRKIVYEKSFAANEKVNGISGALAVTIKSKNENAGRGSLQIGFLYKGNWQADAKYKISFYAKSSKPGKISAMSIMNTKPWAALGAKAKLVADVTTDWKKYSFEFDCIYDYDETARVPVVFLGSLPVGTVFMIQDVKFEKLD